MSMLSANPLWVSRFLSVLRIVAALLFIEHGTQKLFGFPPTPNPLPAFLSLVWVQGILEFGGGFLVLIGLFTRGVAFILSGDMAVAYFMRVLPRNFFPVLSGGDDTVLYCFVFLYLCMAGGGAWSLDRLLWPDRRASLGL
jgi:putative oxidoreductase